MREPPGASASSSACSCKVQPIHDKQKLSMRRSCGVQYDFFLLTTHQIFFHVEQKCERKNSLAVAAAAATTATRSCSHTRDQIAETFQPKKTSKNCVEKIKDRTNLIFSSHNEVDPILFFMETTKIEHGTWSAVCAQWKSRSWGGASSRERRQQCPGRLRRLESGIPQSMSLVGTWIPADSSQSGGLDFRFVVAMVESPKGVQFHFPRWQKKRTLFFLFLFFFT